MDMRGLEVQEACSTSHALDLGAKDATDRAVSSHSSSYCCHKS